MVSQGSMKIDENADSTTHPTSGAAPVPGSERKYFGGTRSNSAWAAICLLFLMTAVLISPSSPPCPKRNDTSSQADTQQQGRQHHPTSIGAAPTLGSEDSYYLNSSMVCHLLTVSHDSGARTALTPPQERATGDTKGKVRKLETRGRIKIENYFRKNTHQQR